VKDKEGFHPDKEGSLQAVEVNDLEEMAEIEVDKGRKDLKNIEFNQDIGCLFPAQMG
jgi:hypothetical protein